MDVFFHNSECYMAKRSTYVNSVLGWIFFTLDQDEDSSHKHREEKTNVGDNDKVQTYLIFYFSICNL